MDSSSKRERDRKLDEVESFIEETEARVSAQTSHVESLTRWLEARKITNGLGQDFEYTLQMPRGARNGHRH